MTWTKSAFTATPRADSAQGSARKTRETLAETRYFEGHHGETRYENGDTEDDGLGIIDGGEEQPWLTYSDGTPIPSNVQFVYANCGGGYDDITYGHAPTFASGSMMDGSVSGLLSRRCKRVPYI